MKKISITTLKRLKGVIAREIERKEEEQRIKESPLILLSNETIILPSSEGTVSLIDSGLFMPKDKFGKNDLVRMRNVVNAPTKARKAHVYELSRDASFGEMFKAVGRNPRKMCFTEHQVVDFIRGNREVLSGSLTTFFPIALECGKVLILECSYFPEHDGIDLYAHEIFCPRTWNATFTRRLAVIR